MEARVDELVFSPAQVLHHAEFIKKAYEEDPSYAAEYLSQFLINSGLADSNDIAIQKTKVIIQELKDEARKRGEDPDTKVLTESGKFGYVAAEGEKEGGGAPSEILDEVSREIIFRKQIEEYYLPKQLIDAIIETGEIPKSSVETNVGIGFIDIADYTYLSKFLSPKENQTVLNGLYTAFNWVLKRHGGYLNKIEGDSIMFHFGGLIDPNVKNLEQKDAIKHISRELFYTCVEMQRVCVLFNQANDKFIYEEADRETKEDLRKAFDIISTLRTSLELSDSMNALFQIRIRIGANVGEVTIGNFGPEGAKQWDVVGLPVIHAKRMEATAPVGGLRISEGFYRILEENGIVDSYYQRFKREAQALMSYFRDITRDELFKFSVVHLKDKKNAAFHTYSIQVNPALPEAIANQVALLLEKGEEGADKIIQLLQYYRGNKFVINAVEAVFKKQNVLIRKDEILRVIFPKKYEAYLKKLGNREQAAEYINDKYSLFNLFEKLGNYQDKVKQEFTPEQFDGSYIDYDQYLRLEEDYIKKRYREKKRVAIQRTFFYNVVFPLSYACVRSSILEYQNAGEVLEEL
jgi:class 3 adenylate cyclase